MQQRVRDGAPWVPGRTWFLASCLMTSALAPALCRAQDQTPPFGGTDLPIVLLVVDRVGGASVQQIDLTAQIKTTLRESLVQSSKFQVHTFFPGESVIKRALLEHQIAADDLAEPYKVEGLERIAKAIGARFILRYHTTLDKTGARTEMKFLQNPTMAEWIAVAEEQVGVPAVIGRRKLRTEDIVHLTVDEMTARVGVPTHLAGDLRQMPGTRIFDDSNPPDKKKRQDRKAKPDTRATDRAPETAGDQSTQTPRPADGVTGAGAPGRSQDTRTAPGKSGRGAPADHPTPIIEPVPPSRPVFTNEADPARGALPVQPAIAPPPVIAHTDFEAQALRYRQTGDLSNAVASLRRAVNERPRDIGLRRQLIQVYQERQLPDAARAEALRALRLDPDNASLYRLYGEVLLAEKDISGAIKAFQDGIKADPADIGCQLAMGDALFADGRFMQAQEAYLAAEKVDVKSPAPHRRMARALVAQAGADSANYKASLEELARARELAPVSDAAAAQEESVAILRIVEARIRDGLDELQAAYQAKVQARRTQTELVRQIADMKERGLALADYLDKLPAPPGQDVTQAHFTQANALLLQTTGFFKDLVEKGDDRFADSMKSGQVQAQRELTTASQRLGAVKPVERPKVAP